MSLGEFELIHKIQGVLGHPSPRVLVGIGDDAAVLVPPPHGLLVTVDSLVEGVHFDMSYFLPEEVGHKALAVNLSDIAAMGGIPLYGVLSLGVGPSFTEGVVMKVVEGISRLAKEYAVDVVGGNISSIAGPSFVDMTIMGDATERPLRRSAAELGDVVAVTGSLGKGRAGYELLRKYGREKIDAFPKCSGAQLRPEARVAMGAELGKSSKVHAMIDVSDGLASELQHVSKASGVGFEIWGEKLPLDPEVMEVSALLGRTWKDWALAGGEDYELLMTFPEAELDSVRKIARAGNVALTAIGKVVDRQSGITIRWAGVSERLESRGWDHLQSH